VDVIGSLRGWAWLVQLGGLHDLSDYVKALISSPNPDPISDEKKKEIVSRLEEALKDLPGESHYSRDELRILNE